MMEKFEILPSSNFVGHRCAQHEESVRRGSHSARFHTFLIAESCDLLNAGAIPFGISICGGFTENALSARKVQVSKEA